MRLVPSAANEETTREKNFYFSFEAKKYSIVYSINERKDSCKIAGVEMILGILDLEILRFFFSVAEK